jgi:DNA-binding GntR family transcriptional regulator
MSAKDPVGLFGRAPRPLRRRSLSDEAADTLRDMILTGDLRPEQRLTQDELAASLSVSTMPVREALLKLAHEGLVEASPNRSFRIVRTTREDIQDIYWMHATLAGELAARACRRQAEDRGVLVRLREHQQALIDAIAADDIGGMESANWNFHREINLAAGAPRLLLMLKGTLRLIPQHFYALVKAWAPVAQTGHRAILAAFEANDPEAARLAALNHVTEAGELIIAQFTDTGYWMLPNRK